VSNRRTILLGDDEPEVRGYFEMALKYLGYRVESAHDGEEVLAYLDNGSSDVAAVLLDVIMPRKDGLETLREIRRMDPTLPVIMISDASSTFNVVEAMKSGATDFLAKPVAHEDLRRVMQNLDVARLRTTVVKPELAAEPSGSVFFGTSSRMQEIQAIIPQIGMSDVPVLVQGETGAGNEVIARELHRNSPRKNKQFLKLNCAALPSELVESELFGYERGAFTGAFQKKAGMFELADGGTILLDEIGDMDFRLQAKLLQVLQDHEFQRIGGKETVHVDVRVIAATHQDLEKAIVERTFREDLYYRINILTLYLPPLRERQEDIVPLAEFLLKRHGNGNIPVLGPALKQAITAYAWPGNVRELENFARRLGILGNQEALVRELQEKTAHRALVRVKPVPIESYRDPEQAATPILEQVTRAKQQAEADAILAALNTTRWNRKQAAKVLKIDYKALLYKMKKLRIDRESPGDDEPSEPPAYVMRNGG